MKKRRHRFSFTSSHQVHRAIDLLLATGLYGNSRSAVIERLVCNGINEKRWLIEPAFSGDTQCVASTKSS